VRPATYIFIAPTCTTTIIWAPWCCWVLQVMINYFIFFLMILNHLSLFMSMSNLI
jgi:hypothetical protein